MSTEGRVCSHRVATNLRCDACGEFLGVPPWSMPDESGRGSSDTCRRCGQPVRCVYGQWRTLVGEFGDASCAAATGILRLHSPLTAPASSPSPGASS